MERNLSIICDESIVEKVMQTEATWSRIHVETTDRASELGENDGNIGRSVNMNNQNNLSLIESVALQLSATELANEWIKEFVRETDKLDQFFVEKCKEFVQHFVDIQRQYLKKYHDNKLISPSEQNES